MSLDEEKKLARRSLKMCGGGHTDVPEPPRKITFARGKWWKRFASPSDGREIGAICKVSP
jgi:hypothetical protein